MPQVGKTQLVLVKNENGSISLYKGSRLDSVHHSERELHTRIKELKEIGYGHKLEHKVKKLGF